MDLKIIIMISFISICGNRIRLTDTLHTAEPSVNIVSAVSTDIESVEDGLEYTTKTKEA